MESLCLDGGVAIEARTLLYIIGSEEMPVP
jgi:hypothetical protein